MEPFHEYMEEYRKQLKKGVINKAYRGLMEYIMDLRSHFKNKYPDYSVPGSIYYGYMDMTYFPLFPTTLKQHNLKIAIVFVHEEFRFEIWLAGSNKLVQQKYWKLFKDSDWNKYHVVSTLEGVDSIVDSILADKPDFSDLNKLTYQIETGSLTFIKDVENFLLEQHN